MDPVLRVANLDDAQPIEALMKESAAAIFPRWYSEQQAASAVEHVAVVDRMLLEDGTYFVLEADGEVVACGGWSRRDRLYTGSGDGADDARIVVRHVLPQVLASIIVLSSLLMAIAQGNRDWIGLPIFTSRRFFHTRSWVRTDSAIESIIAGVLLPARRAGWG